MTKSQVQSSLTITHHQQTAQYFNEDLGSGAGLAMVLIESDKFMMGSPEDELSRFDNESPQRRVSITTFFIGKFPVTQRQWRIVAGTYRPVDLDLNPNPSSFKGEMRPVEQVNWFEAVEFCTRLSQHTGRQYRLPTEAEWEYACRAGTTTPFHFGETITTDLANYDGSARYDREPVGIRRGETTEVGSLNNPNDFGLYDMHGNVWEWCQDHWDETYNRHPLDGSAWIIPTESNDSKHPRVLRGGAWGDDPKYCRSACRFKANPYSRDRGDGFRVVCSATSL